MTGAVDLPMRPSPGENATWQLSTKVCRISHFLAEETAELLLSRATHAAQEDLYPSRVRGNQVDTRTRRALSHVGFDAEELTDAINKVRGPVERALGISCEGTEPAFALNIHNDGDFYQPHQDVSSHEAAKGMLAANRVVTFVYYMHRTPVAFSGGALRMYDTAAPLRMDGTLDPKECSYRDYPPEHNSVIFFAPSALHEVRRVSCPSREHADSRFAINGWLCRNPAVRGE
ncbi:2OG-Fe(II) oxygenase [Streptomyces scopuliridis]|uniref:2OG-Fe(II) oxygenase n=1 Tax=Streptomyces scopuliridis TaxID=452529 RepID=A0ACD4ZZ41_9ACTN|nr:2OG-Fe(II) oxygenase [Streptomyces scopuliridis]WSB37910.1 2OG-Fe(II) oxygenase [Streptomyces scopuliridis]WSC02362.1 2OG-Fe(II) oxygenase [Streptomyces scopuliridis]WSC04101.1 2OG-Fe(II) oxygenase [Streptomyces scopuliridis]